MRTAAQWAAAFVCFVFCWRLVSLVGPASQGPSLVPPAGGLAPLKRGSAKRWGLTCWHCFYLQSEIEAVVLRQSPALAPLRGPLCQSGRAAAPLVGPCFAGPIPRPARRRPGPFEKGLPRSGWGLTCWHCFYLKSEIEADVLRQSPALAPLRGPLCQKGRAAAPLVGPCFAGLIPRPGVRTGESRCRSGLTG